MIEILKKVECGDFLLRNDFSENNDELDSLALQVNRLIEKAWLQNTEYRLLLDSLTESFEKYRNLLSIIPGVVFLLEMRLDGSYSFPYVSDSSRVLFGLEPKEIMRDARLLFDRIHQDDRELVFDSIDESVRTHGPWKTEFRLVLDDAVRWYECISNPVKQPECEAMWDGIMIDITDRKRAEDALRKSEECYRGILDSMREGYFEVDLKGNLVFFNGSVAKNLGYSEDELRGMNFRQYMDEENVKKVYNAFNRVYSTGETEVAFDWEIATKQGQKLIIESSVSLIRDERGRPIGFSGVVRDFSRHKREEAELLVAAGKYFSLLENIGTSYHEMDLKGNFTFFNNILSRDLGYTREELMGMNYRVYTKPENLEWVKSFFSEIFRTGKAKTLSNYEVIRKDGSTYNIELSTNVLRDASDKPIGFQCVARDITERIRAEQALKESEEKYRTVLEIMNEGYFENDLKGNFTFANDAACRLMGYKHDELIGLNYSKIHPPDVAQFLKEVYTRAYQTGKPEFLAEYQIIRRDGSRRTHQLNMMPVQGSSGKPAFFRNLVRDVTDRKAAEEALTKSEEKYRTILESMDEGLYETDMKGNYTFVNEAGCRIVGYECDELIGKNSSMLHSRETLEYIVSVYNEMMKTGKTGILMDYEAIRKDGSITIHQANAAFILDETGKRIGTRALVRDVTDRKRAEDDLRKSEARYRIIAENVHDTIWTMDLGLKYTYISPSVAKMRGYTPDELLQMPLSKQMTKESYGLVEQVVSEELVKEIGPEPVDPDRSRVMELELTHKSGGTIWVEVTVTFIRDKKAKALEILGVTRDISERKRAEAERARLENQLLQSHKMESVGRLAGGVAHDFNNMLSVILGYCELLKIQLPKSSNFMKDLLEIERAASRSKDMTSQLLAFSRKQIISPIVVDLNGMIADTQKSLSRLIGEDIDLRFYPAKKLWKIRFDPAQIQQILINLAANARDAMLKGGRLTIETANVHLNEAYCKMHLGFVPGNYVTLIISDDGEGMDKETLQHIFEPFFTTKETGKGTGLGLATVYGIVKQNRGFINVYSEMGRGTTFKIYIPRARGKGETREESEDEHVARGAGTVILVEDDEMVRKMTTEMLQAIGYKVISMENALEALSLFESGNTQADLVITDVVMPGMSGKELRDRLKIIDPAIKVLFMSGYTSNVILHHGALDENVHFVQKPFKMHDLAKKVREAMKSR